MRAHLSALPGDARARVEVALAGYDRSRDLHGRAAADDLDSSIISGATQARADLQPARSHGAAGVSVAPGGAGLRHRFDRAISWAQERLVSGHLAGRCHHHRIPRVVRADAMV